MIRVRNKKKALSRDVRIFLACSLFAPLLAVGVPAVPAAAASEAASFAVQADDTTGVYPHYEKVNGKERARGLLGTADAVNAGNIGMDIIRSFVFADTTAPAEGTYNFSTQTANLDDILSMGASPMLSITKTPEWLADKNFNGLDDEYYSWEPPVDFDKYETMLTDIIAHYKDAYPSIVYIEAWNEPDLTKRDGTTGTVSVIPDSTYKLMYERFVNAVETVNATLAPGVPQLKVGGPVTHHFDFVKIKDLIDYAHANPLKLDFVSWHTYNHKTNPIAGQLEADQVRTYLDSLGMNDVEIYVTEFGYAGGGTNSKPTAAEFAQSAAYMAAQNYYFGEAGVDKAFQWDLRHSTNQTKSQLGTSNGQVYPLYNLLQMMTMMKHDQVSVGKTTSVINTHGIGPNTIATASGDGVSVLYWNYQNTGSDDYNVTLDVYGLPPSFTGKKIRAEQYVIDTTHSNAAYNPGLSLPTAWTYNPYTAKLAKVSDQLIDDDPTYHASRNLEPNSIALTVLTPVTDLLLSDGFDGGTTGGDPAGWTVTEAAGTSLALEETPDASGKRVVITDSSANGYASLSKSFAPQSGTLIAEWTFEQPNTAMHYGRFTLRSGTDVAIDMYTKSNGKLVYRDGSGVDHDVQPFLVGTPYTIKLAVDCASNTYDIYVDGFKQVEGALFRNPATSIDNIQIASAKSGTGTMRIDDVSVWSE